MRHPNSTPPIFFFDGVCGFCNGFVDLLLRLDRHGRLKFATLQGETAKKLLDRHDDLPMSSSVLILDGIIYEKSEAALRCFSVLGGAWRGMLVFRVLPRSLRDWIYDQVAIRRYSIWGKRESCRIPPPQERARFLP